MKFLFGSKTKQNAEKPPAAPADHAPLSARPTSTERPDRASADAMQELKKISAALAEVKTYSKATPSAAAAKSELTEEDKRRLHDRSIFKALLNGLYDAVLIFDSQGTVVESNGRAEQFFGYEPSGMWNLPCDKLFSAINIRVLSKIRSYATAGRFTVVNAACMRKDGSTFPAEIAASQVNLLSEGNLIFSIRNLERREKARERHDMEIEALKYAGAAIVVCRSDGLIAFANPAFLRMLRLAESKDVLNRFIGEFCTSYESVNAAMKMPSAHGAWFGRLELQAASGEVMETLVTAALSQKQKDGSSDIVLTLTPIPKAVR